MQATLNVRMNSVVKERGDQVLKQYGISTSEAVRALWSYLGKEKKLPSFMESADEATAREEKARKLAAAKQLIALSEKIGDNPCRYMTDEEIKEVIASKYLEPGETLRSA